MIYLKYAIYLALICLLLAGCIPPPPFHQCTIDERVAERRLYGTPDREEISGALEYWYYPNLGILITFLHTGRDVKKANINYSCDCPGVF